MDRQEVMDELSDIFKPAQVWAVGDSWSFRIDTVPARVLTVNKSFADHATPERLRELVKSLPGGDALINQRGDLIVASR